MTGKELINDLTKGNVTKKLLTFAFPFMLSTLMQTAYSTADMVIVGRYVGSSGLSAVSTSSQFLWLTTSLCMGFTNGEIIISQLLGQAGGKICKDHRDSSQYRCHRCALCHRFWLGFYQTHPAPAQHTPGGFRGGGNLPFHCFHRNCVYLWL